MGLRFGQNVGLISQSFYPGRSRRKVKLFFSERDPVWPDWAIFNVLRD